MSMSPILSALILPQTPKVLQLHYKESQQCYTLSTEKHPPLPGKTKELCYITLVRPLVEYSSIIWDPFPEANIWKLEMVKRRAARMVFSDYRRTSSVTPMLHHLQWPTLQERRAHAKVTMMYRIVNGLVEVPTTSLTTTISARGHGLHYLVPFARTQCYQRSFFPDTIRLWKVFPCQL